MHELSWLVRAFNTFPVDSSAEAAAACCCCSIACCTFVEDPFSKVELFRFFLPSDKKREKQDSLQMLPKVAQTTMDGFVECAKTFDILAFEAGG